MSAAVNKPTNVKQKEVDIDAKLKLYGIYSAFALGKVPSNQQIDIALNSALASKALSSPSKRLSSEGHQLVADLRDVIEKAKLLLLSKNEGNLLQDFIWKCQQIDGANATTPNAPVDKATAQQHGNEALDGLRTLGTLIISNGQFRKLLNDLTILFRDVAGDAAQSAAGKINPSDDKLAQIDKPAADNTWHEVPSVADMKAQASSKFDRVKPVGKNDLKDAAGSAVNTAQPDGTDDPRAADPGAGAAAGLSNIRDKAQANVSDEDQEKIKNKAVDLKESSKAKTKEYFNKKLPQERREQTVWRLKKMIVEIQGHDDYNQAIETLLSLAETYGGHSQDIAQQAAGTVKDTRNDNSLLTAEADLKTLIERFANHTSSDDLFDSIKQIYRDAANDPELRNWFISLDHYIRKCLQQTGYVLEDVSNEEGNRLYDQGRFLLRERYRDHTNRIIDEVKFLANEFNADPMNRSFADSMNKLFLDLGNDENGKPTFKKHLVTDLTNVIIPAFFENVSYIPIPRIEYSDHMIDAIVENLVVESDNLFPNSFEVQSDNYFKWGRKTVASRNKNKMMIAASGIQMDLKDVSYYINKKEGFPSLKDTGIMDIFMGGQGFGFKLAVETADSSDKAHFFKVSSVKVDIKHLKLKMKKSNHKLLFNIAKPLLLSVVKPVLTKVIEKQIADYFRQGDAFAYAINQEANSALEEAANNPENIPNIYSRYVTAFQRKIEQGKKKTAEVTSDKQANVAITQHDSIFQDVKLPGGISTAAAKYKDLASEGTAWESPVFGLGSASASTNIPKAATISRKPHDVTNAQLRDPSRSNVNNNITSSNNLVSGAPTNSNYNSETGTPFKSVNGNNALQNDAPVSGY